MQDFRREGAGAVFSERCNSREDLSARGTVTGNPYIVAGPRGGRATLFDGDDDKVGIPVNRSINSFVAWVYFTTTTEEVADFDGGTHYLKATGGTLAATGWAAPTIYVDGAAGTTVTVGWHHIVATSATAFTCTNLQLGTDNTGFGAVYIADVCLWPRALSAAEVLQEFNGTTWAYDLSEITRLDMSQTDPQDVGWRNSGNSGTGTGLVASTDIVPCPYGGYAIEFDGTERVDVAANAAFDITDVSASPFCVMTLLKVNQTPAVSNSIFTFGGTDYNALTFGVQNNLTLQIVASTNGSSWGILNASTSALTVGRWHTVGLSRDTSGVYRFLIDGADAGGSFTNTSDLFLSSLAVRIAGHYNSVVGYPLRGVIADCRFFSSALSIAQSADLTRRLTGGL